MTDSIEHIEITGITYTDDDGTKYRRIMTDEGIKEFEVSDRS